MSQMSGNEQLVLDQEAREVLNFLNAMIPIAEMAERTEATLKRKLGTAFYIADYSIGGSEVPLNRVLADLLNSRGPHGQGGVFLELFIKTLKYDVPVGDIETWRVVPSYRTEHGRYVDIALFRPKHVAIYIECKPWANEGERQLEDYAKDLLLQDKKNKDLIRGLIFVPGFIGREPETLESDTRQCLERQGFNETLPYQRSQDRDGHSIVEWLERCVAACEAENVRLFIQDLARYLDAEFHDDEEGVFMNNDRFIDMIIGPIKANKDYLNIVSKLEDLPKMLKKNVAQQFIKGLRGELEQVMDTSWIVESDAFEPNSGFPILTLRKKEWAIGWLIALEMGAENFADFHIGFCCPSKTEHLKKGGLDSQTPLATEADRAVIRDALKDPLTAIYRVQQDAWWPAYSFLPDPLRNWNGEALLLLSGHGTMPDGRTVMKTLVDYFQELARAAEATVDGIFLNQHANARRSP